MGEKQALSYWHEHEEEFDVILLNSGGQVIITEGLDGAFTSEAFPVTVEKRK